jgi:hypothetical protein
VAATAGRTGQAIQLFGDIGHGEQRLNTSVDPMPDLGPIVLAPIAASAIGIRK